MKINYLLSINWAIMFANILHRGRFSILRYSLCIFLSLLFIFLPHPSRVSFLCLRKGIGQGGDMTEYDAYRRSLYIYLAFVFQRPRTLEQLRDYAEEIKEIGV